ncbi:hypothetical protein KEM48_012686 [Puccinia striiformis f. sp. tritici PST-130]|nr:hypothetical protein KEM48_012686 [Puccinia striiformis f. sp. tritici PST-130]
MVAIRGTKPIELIAEQPSQGASSNNNHSVDRRERAVKSCSNWNSALLHGRRTRGPQWDYPTASYHVSKGSKEYYKGVTRIHTDQPTPNPQPRLTLPDRHPLSFQQDPSDQPFQNRPIIRHSSQGSNHGRAMANSVQYPIHPTHLQLVANQQQQQQQQAFNNAPNLIPSPHFQQPGSALTLFLVICPPPLLCPPHNLSARVNPIQVSFILRIVTSMTSDKKNKPLGSYHNPNNNPQQQQQQPIERSHSTQLPPSFSPAPYQVSAPGGPTERIESPTHSQTQGSPVPAHGGNAGIESTTTTTNRKIYPIPPPFSQRPSTPGPLQAPLPPIGGQVFQPIIHPGYQSSNPSQQLPISISSQARFNLQQQQQPKPHILPPPPPSNNPTQSPHLDPIQFNPAYMTQQQQQFNNNNNGSVGSPNPSTNLSRSSVHHLHPPPPNSQFYSNLAPIPDPNL